MQLQSTIKHINASLHQFNDLATKSGLLGGDLHLAQQLQQIMKTNRDLLELAAQERVEVEEDKEVVASQTDPLPQSPKANVELDSSATSVDPATREPEIVFGQQQPYSFMPETPNTDNHQEPLASQFPNTGSTVPAPIDHKLELDVRSDQHPSTQELVVRTGGDQQYTNPRQESVSISATASGYGDEIRCESSLVPSSAARFTPGSADVSAHGPGFVCDWEQGNQSYPANTSMSSYEPYNQTPANYQLPSISMATLALPCTYSHNETRFARRLTRAALEAGLYLLSTSDESTPGIGFLFKLSLPYITLINLRNNVREVLNRSVNQELDNLRTPYLHVGGAGTHYPRRDAFGNVMIHPNSWKVCRIGPTLSRMIRIEGSRGINHDLTVDFAGYEGEWFDPHDVEGYLAQEKGCYIDPRAAYTQVWVDMDQPTTILEEDMPAVGAVNSAMYSQQALDVESDVPSFSTGTTSVMSPSSNETSSHVANTANDFFSHGGGGGVDAYGFNFMNLSSTATPAIDFNQVSNIDPLSQLEQPLGLDMAPGVGLVPGNPNYGKVAPLPALRKKMAWLDVGRFITELIGNSVCLGRAPGYKRQDVESAFQRCLISYF